MNPSQILTFALVGQLKSISRAAEFLHIGQPAVSGQLKLLQDAVGEPLYVRDGHRIRLTPVGEGLLEHAEQLRRNLLQIEEYVHRLQRINCGILRIGSTVTIGSYYLPQYVVRMQTLYPGLEVHMKTGDSREIVQCMPELDVGFVEGAIDPDELPASYRLLPWCEDEIVLVVREDHELALTCDRGVPLEVFAKYQVLWRERGSGARAIIENALSRQGIEVPVNIQVTGVAGVKASVRAGLGIGFASARALKEGDSELVGRRIDPPHGLRWQLNILAPIEKMRSRAVKAFLELCADEKLLV
ncbi:MAG: LysR substrate-binding domain-containing protein [Methylococcaceae bacterium]|nr:LysR substrate-binding domain-containing protein [Methylococcaceae bacterium]MCI0734158.1 LysR substrate-binding domain-containing protein [Methylococcaceae bacterium]